MKQLKLNFNKKLKEPTKPRSYWYRDSLYRQSTYWQIITKEAINEKDGIRSRIDQE
jgi:hypothetical protein